MLHNFKILLSSSTMFELLFIAIFITILYNPSPCLAQDETGSFEFEGITRNYEVYRPQNYQPNMPLVVSLHGREESIHWYKSYTRMHEATDTMGFVLVYPEGYRRSWNAGIVDNSFSYSETNDVGFISDLIDTMKSRWDIDLSRVYCCGFSNGEAMTYRIAGELGHRIAAIAGSSGPLYGLANTWNHYKPMPVLKMHGTEDILVPYDGDGGDRWPAEDAVDYWVNINECTAVPDTIALPDIFPSDNCTIQKISYTNCSGESQVIFYKGLNMGHSWPGSAFTFATEGNKNRDINANVEILNFFKKFTNPLAYAAFGKYVEDGPKYISPSGEILNFRAEIWNPLQHPVNVYGMIYNNYGTCLDSVQLFDDGLHDDGEASDHIWAASKMITLGQGGDFQIGLRTRDLHEETTHYLHHSARPYFTTKGPVKFESLEITSPDSIPNPGDRIKFSLTLKNYGITDTVFDADVNIILPDNPNIYNSTTGVPEFGDIAPGESLTNSSRDFAFNFYEGCEPGEYEFGLEITSNDLPYWYDTFKITVAEPTGVEDDQTDLPTEYALEQNYPNPFNPATTIKYSIPVDSKQYTVGSRKNQEKESPLPRRGFRGGLMNVKLKVYDVLGKEVATLVNEQQRPGHYEVKWDAAGQASGVYFYKLETGSFLETKKMLLLK